MWCTVCAASAIPIRFFKRFTAESFYKLLNAMGAEVVYNHADYRLMSARVLQEFAKFKEVNLFLRGMVPLVGFKSTSVTYERHERIAGESHYPLSKMLSLAFDGITSLSIKPIRFITGFGVIVALISFIGVIWAMVEAILGLTVSGWASDDQHYLLCVRRAADLPGRDWRVHRQNLHGDQAPPALYYQRDDAELWAKPRRITHEPSGLERFYPAEPGAAGAGELRQPGKAESYHRRLVRYHLHPAADAVHQRAARAIQP